LDGKLLLLYVFVVTVLARSFLTSLQCGYACSDHASWYEQGFPTAMPFETTFGDDNPVIHSEDDTVDAEGFSWEHTLEFAKLATAYLYEASA